MPPLANTLGPAGKTSESYAAYQLKESGNACADLRTFTPAKTSVPIRVAGTIVSERDLKDNVETYYIESSVGRVPITPVMFANGGIGGVEVIDLHFMRNRSVRLTGTGHFLDAEHKQPRFESITKLEYAAKSPQ